MRIAEHLQVSSELLDWFSENRLSLVLSFRHEQALVFLSPDGEGQLRSIARRIQRPRCLHVDRSRVMVATDHQIHELVNVLPDSATYDRYDKIYILRRTHTTGAIDIRDLDGNAPGSPYFISDRYNVVGTLSDTYSFEVCWQPSSSNQHVSEVPFRLTGVTRDNRGEACYATGTYDGDSEGGSSAMGAVIDVDSDNVVTEGAFSPIDPQFYDGDLYVVDAQNNALVRIEKSGETEVVMHFPRVPSRVSLQEGVVVAVMSGSVGDADSSSPEAASSSAPRPHLSVIELETGTPIGKAQWPNEMESPTEVEVLPDAECPAVLGPDTADLPYTIVFKADNGIVHHRLSAEQGDSEASGQEAFEEGSTSPSLPEDLASPGKTRQAARIEEGQEYSFFRGQVNAHEFLSRFQSLTAERFRRRARTGAVPRSTPLLGVAVTLGNQPVGAAAISIPDDAGASHVHSLKVSPPHRGQGLGTELLKRLELRAREAGAGVLEGGFRASISSLPSLERVFEKRNWEPPKVKRYLYKGERARVPKPFLDNLSREPASGTLFEWADLTDDERADIKTRLASTGESAIPESLSPFQLGIEPDLDCSVGLRHDGRVAGWMITHRVREDLLQYTTLYVDSDLRGPGVGPTLLAEAIRRHDERTDIPKFIWMVDAEKTRMRRFIDLQLSEVVDVQDKLLVVGKRLGSK